MSKLTRCDQCEKSDGFIPWIAVQQRPAWDSSSATGSVTPRQTMWDFCSMRCLEDWARERAH